MKLKKNIFLSKIFLLKFHNGSLNDVVVCNFKTNLNVEASNTKPNQFRVVVSEKKYSVWYDSKQSLKVSVEENMFFRSYGSSTED